MRLRDISLPLVLNLPICVFFPSGKKKRSDWGDSHQVHDAEETELLLVNHWCPNIKLLSFSQFWSSSPWAQTPWTQSQGVDFPLLVVRVLMACTLQIRRENFPFLAILKSPSNFLSRHNTEVSLSLFVDLINLVRLGTILTKILLERPYCLNFVFSTYITIRGCS